MNLLSYFLLKLIYHQIFPHLLPVVSQYFWTDILNNRLLKLNTRYCTYRKSSMVSKNLNTIVGFYTKIALHHRPQPQKLNISNISAVTDPSLIKL